MAQPPQRGFGRKQRRTLGSEFGVAGIDVIDHQAQCRPRALYTVRAVRLGVVSGRVRLGQHDRRAAGRGEEHTARLAVAAPREALAPIQCAAIERQRGVE